MSYMTEKEMFEKSFERPSNYFKLRPREQRAIDKQLGILDWSEDRFTAKELERFHAHYEK